MLPQITFSMSIIIAAFVAAFAPHCAAADGKEPTENHQVHMPASVVTELMQQFDNEGTMIGDRDRVEKLLTQYPPEETVQSLADAFKGTRDPHMKVRILSCCITLFNDISRDESGQQRLRQLATTALFDNDPRVAEEAVTALWLWWFTPETDGLVKRRLETAKDYRLLRRLFITLTSPEAGKTVLQEINRPVPAPDDEAGRRDWRTRVRAALSYSRLDPDTAPEDLPDALCDLIARAPELTDLVVRALVRLRAGRTAPRLLKLCEGTATENQLALHAGTAILDPGSGYEKFLQRQLEQSLEQFRAGQVSWNQVKAPFAWLAYVGAHTGSKPLVPVLTNVLQQAPEELRGELFVKLLVEAGSVPSYPYALLVAGGLSDQQIRALVRTSEDARQMLESVLANWRSSYVGAPEDRELLNTIADRLETILKSVTTSAEGVQRE